MSTISKILMVIVLVAGVGTGVYISMNQKPKVNAPVSIPAPPAAVKESVKVKIYLLGVKDNEPMLVPMEIAVKQDENPKEAAILGLLEQGDKNGLANPIPKGTKLLGLKVKDGIASVNLSREFRDHFAGGSEEEAFLIGSFLKTLGQFPDVKRVSFLIEGKPLDTLGHIDLSAPCDVNWEWS